MQAPNRVGPRGNSGKLLGRAENSEHAETAQSRQINEGIRGATRPRRIDHMNGVPTRLRATRSALTPTVLQDLPAPTRVVATSVLVTSRCDHSCCVKQAPHSIFGIRPEAKKTELSTLKTKAFGM